MTLSKNLLQCIEDFLVEFAQKKFNEAEIKTWAMLNLPTFSKDNFYFFRRTLLGFCIPTGSGTFYVNFELVNNTWKNSFSFLKRFAEANKKVK